MGHNLLDAILREGPENGYCLVVPRGVGYEAICERALDAEIHAVPAMGPLARLRYDERVLPGILSSYEPDALLALDSTHAIRGSMWPQGVFVQDAHPVYPVKHHGPTSLRERVRLGYLKWHFDRSLPSTAVVFVQTHAMAARLRDSFGYAGKIRVSGSAVSTGHRQSSQRPSRVPDGLLPYVDRFKLLLVAQYGSHKGIERTIDVFHRYRDELSGVVVFLTLETTDHRNVGRILARIKRWKLDDQVVNLGKISHGELAAYYQHCDAMLMPSTLESLGFPFIEALAYGLPILASDLDFARETCGDAAVYFDPWDQREIKDRIVELSGDPGLQEQLTAAAAERSSRMKSLTWRDIATGILDDLREVAS